MSEPQSQAAAAPSSPPHAGSPPTSASPAIASGPDASDDHLQPIEVNDEDSVLGAEDDARSDYASDVSDTASVTSSVFNFEYENGRRYHSYRAGQYLLPNDDKEQDRLDLTHHVFSLTLHGELCISHLENPRRILNLGTGTGIWAIDAGDQFPAAEVIGTDLSPIQSSWVPPNVRFEVDDATLPWTWPRDHFDFVHARTLGGAIKDWPTLLRQCRHHLVPGGQVEIAEGRADFFCDDGTLTESSKTYQWLSEFRRLAQPLGFDIAPALPQLLEDAGFEDVRIVQRRVPLGTWPKDAHLREIGRAFRVQFVEYALEAYSLALFTRLGGWTNEEAQVLFAMVRDEMKTNKVHLYTYTAFVTGRKPTTATS
ncbi:Secondary metabolism regulator LAE1 like protein [Verticillium longisporum]|uniref:Secondary metabolism regulator LAE1 like protein n=1 Tax=Verticillium longisporum TaxID=100787 RepID=A0A8I2ZW50_VERLO|nr:Secondary metabolism regulator LAE1 like protein [Verticillium longisporum]